MFAKLSSPDLPSEALTTEVAFFPARRSCGSDLASAARREKENVGRQRRRSHRKRRLRIAGDVNLISQTQRDREREQWKSSVTKRHRWQLAAPSCLARELFISYAQKDVTEKLSGLEGQVECERESTERSSTRYCRN
ncbi:hypothetical protein V8G54_002995 [Vigna mungo]|uniref:Uncharacterized protein n=1 Tax=Vigna mungo TaxID=3915 RepID=A0AAQ3SD86_VIGMU